MPDIDTQCGEVVAILFRAARTLPGQHLELLLENVSAEIAAAMMEEEARRRTARVAIQRKSAGNVIPFVSSGPERCR